MGGTPNLPIPGQPQPMQPHEFTGGSVPAITSFRFSDVSPASPLYVQRDDVLVLQVACLNQLDTVVVTVRLQLPAAEQPGQPSDAMLPTPPPAPKAGGPATIKTIQVAFKPNGAGNVNTKSIVLAEGYLLSVGIVSTLSVLRGNTLVRAFLNRGPVVTDTPNAALPLCCDYTSRNHVVGWPYGRIVHPSEGPGGFMVYNLTQPGVGTDLGVGFQLNGSRGRLQQFTAKLVTSAAAGNRVPSFQFRFGTSAKLYTVQDTAVVAPSTTIIYNLIPGGPVSRGAGAIGTELDVLLPLPSPCMFDGSTSIFVSTTTQGILGADQWSNVGMFTEEWLDLA